METQIPLGAHLITPRLGYWHHGISIGDSLVVHYSGLSEGLHAGPIEIVDINTFAAGSEITVKTYKGAFPAPVIVQRAKSRIGESAYNVFNNNCEHFCLWCCTGDNRSAQVDAVTTIGAPIAGGLAFTSAFAAVAGMSGPGMMSELGSIGAVLGGGTVAVLGGAPAALAALTINKTVLADRPDLSRNEREARNAGRTAAYAAAVGATVVSVATMSAAGAGLSAAGIMSGLAAIGGFVGGGVGAGVFVMTAGPALLTAVVGYAAFSLARWIKS